VLEELHRAQPGYHLTERWLGALDARRLGRIALRGATPERGRLMAGFWLDAQKPVWVRTAPAAEGERLAAEAALQGELALPGIAPVVEHGVASGNAYVAVAGGGQPLQAIDDGGAAGLARAAAIVRLLHALALAGAVLPDAEPERFLVQPDAADATLADLDGAERAEPDRAAEQARALAHAVVDRHVGTTERRLPAAVAAALDEARADAHASLGRLVRALDAAVARLPDGFARPRRKP